MPFLGRSAPAPAPAPVTGGMGRLGGLLLVAGGIAIVVILAAHAGLSLPTSGDGTVTVTVPHAPSVTMPRPDDGTMAQLQVVQAGASFGSWAKLLILTVLQMLIYVGLGGMALGAGLWKTHVFRVAGQAVMTTAGIGIVIVLALAAAINYILPHAIGLAFGAP